MAIDGTWRRDCVLNAVSETHAELTVEGTILGLNLKEFFFCCLRRVLLITDANWSG
jgi:hypothetical protein